MSRRLSNLPSLSMLLLVLTVSCSHRQIAMDRQPSFVSKRASEAILRFSHFVELKSPLEPTLEVALEQIEAQVAHLFGPMERSPSSAVPKEDHQITKVRVKPKPKQPGTFLISYNYKGTIVLESGPRKYYEVYLPNDPNEIYSQARETSGDHCTDEHYNAEEDFWYFWAPANLAEREKCRLEKDVHYQVVKASVERLEGNKRTTYPEYNRLADKNGVIDTHIFFGMNEAGLNRDPYKSSDLNAKTYLATVKSLKEMGFEISRWSNEDVKRTGQVLAAKDTPFVEEATKDFPAKGLTLRVRLFFGETGIDENSKAFHFFFKDSMEKAAVMIYDGHSGLGGHLNLAAIASLQNIRITPNKDKYQIFFFNSCTSYTYYNALYFERKRGRARTGDRKIDFKGTKNLDILANGLSTSFIDMHNTNMSLISAIDLWATQGKWTSYKGLAKTIDTENLFTVNGDEDNPTRPVRK